MANVCPTPHILESMRNCRQDWKIMLGELIDNSLDADSKDIEIKWGHRYLKIEDNGIGCKNVLALVTPGMHEPHEGKRMIGRYGIGCKDVAVWLWGRTIIKTTSKGKTFEVEADWHRISKTPDWYIPDPIINKSENEEIGTSIVFEKIDFDRGKRFPEGKAFEKLINWLGFTYSLAIEDGARIKLSKLNESKFVLKAFKWPQRQNILEASGYVKGKEIKINIGIVPTGVENPRCGLTYRYKYRVISNLSSTGFGCGDYNFERIAGWVDLSDDWNLTKNKDDLADLKEELETTVENICKPVLQMAHEAADQFSSDLFQNQVNEDLSKLLDTLKEKEKRGEGDTKGTVDPEDKRKRQKAKNIQVGDKVLNNIGMGAVQIIFCDLSEDDGFGKLDFNGRVKTIKVSQNDPLVKALRKPPTGPEKRFSFLSNIIGLIANYGVINKTGQLPLRFEKYVKSETDTTSEKYSQLLAKIGYQARQQIFGNE